MPFTVMREKVRDGSMIRSYLGAVGVVVTLVRRLDNGLCCQIFWADGGLGTVWKVTRPADVSDHFTIGNLSYEVMAF